MTDFREKQISKLQAAIAKVEEQKGEAVNKVRSSFKAKRELLECQATAAGEQSAARFQQKLDVLEKQLKALGGK